MKSFFRNIANRIRLRSDNPDTCVFRVEDTLFKVHKCYLLREPSAFGDMFSLIDHLPSNQSSSTPIPLYDTADEFRDLLWALYAVPPQLICASADPTRLLNIAQLANKYCIASYEAWALDRLISLAKNPNSFIRHASPQICARALHVAFLCDHQPLIDIILQKLVPRILWSDSFDRQPILQLGIPILQGIIYYRNLVDLFNAHQITRDQDHHAYESLVRLWDRIRTTPPSFEKDEQTCTDPEHIQCLATWSNLWSTAASSEQTVTKCAVVDVLGRLKCMMIQLKKAMESRSTDDAMSLGCTLLALESITVARDEIVDGLIDHFR